MDLGGIIMKKVSIIFGSTTGNTERVANLIKDYMAGCDVSVSNVTDANDDMVKSADLVLFGSSTWGYGELQDDFLPYYESMNSGLLSGKDVAVFGCGDEAGFGDVFCEAVKLIAEKASDCGANVIGEGLKVDGDVDDNVAAIEAFAKSFA